MTYPSQLGPADYGFDPYLMPDAGGLRADLDLRAPDIDTRYALVTAVLMSLGTDRALPPGTPPPEGEAAIIGGAAIPGVDPIPYAGGWWADAPPIARIAYPNPPGSAAQARHLGIGCGWWRLRRSIRTEAVRQAVEAYALEALDWLLADRVANRVEVAATFPVNTRNAIACQIHIIRTLGQPLTMQFDDLFRWIDTGDPAVRITEGA